jgi:hypothetical protein
MRKYGSTIREIRKLRVLYFSFSGFSELMTELVIVPHIYSILDLITGQAVNIKRGVYFIDPYGAEIREVRILSGLVRVRRGDCGTQYTVVALPLPATSPAPPPQ